MYALNLSWGISFTIAYLAQCSPISDFWSKPIDHRHCINISIHEYFAISSIILDVLILCMPWPMVWRLQMALKHKVAVLSIFMLGAMYVFPRIALVCIASNHRVLNDREAALFEAMYFWLIIPRVQHYCYKYWKVRYILFR